MDLRTKTETTIEVAHPELVSPAQQVFDAGDRWFLTVTLGIVRVGGWARRVSRSKSDRLKVGVRGVVGVDMQIPEENL